MRYLRQAFTLIELLVVIGIIGIIIGMGTIAYSTARDKADDAKVQADFQTMRKLIDTRRFTENKLFGEITGDYCTECPCRGVDPTSSATCMSDLNASWDTITTEQPLLIDPWGNPYLMDENEHEAGPADCRFDHLKSSGKDGIFYNGDDITYEIPHFICD